MAVAAVTGNLIGARLQKRRKESGMTQTQLAAALEVDFNISASKVFVSQIERGIRTVRDKEIFALCKILNVSPDDLFGWD